MRKKAVAATEQAATKSKDSLVTFQEAVPLIRDQVNALLAPERQVVPPNFQWDGPIARWSRDHQWATFAISPETGPQFGHLLVLGRTPILTSPFGAQATPLPFLLNDGSIGVIAHAIADHFSWPA